MVTTTRRLALTLAVFVPAIAFAAEVYKCPGPDGKTEYSDRPCSAGKTVTIAPNAVGEIDQSAVRAKAEALDRRTNARIAAQIVENDRRAAYQQGRINECQSYIDTADRQRAWLGSVSGAVRQSAANEIAIQRRKYEASDCGRVMR